MSKINQYHRASVVARVTKDRARVLERGADSKNSRHSPTSYPQVEAQFAPATHLGDECG